MTEAIFGLLGVLVGGMLNVMIGFLESSHQQRQLARTAARLVLEELRENEVKLVLAERNEVWEPLHRLETADWNNYRGDLANSLNDSEWNEVSHAFRWLRSLEEDIPGHDPEDEFDLDNQAFVRSRKYVARASELIAERAGVKVNTIPLDPASSS